LRALDGEELMGQMVLEIPLQIADVPRDIVNYARQRRPPIVIRDEFGREY
jgi:hypothetical protein